jgi:hypothetical protein
MDINHPLYVTLKDYYTNLDLNSSNIDNSLLIQYIEDTYKIKNDNKSDNYDCLKPHHLECDRMYFVNIIKTSETLELYCHFTNKFLNKPKKTFLSNIYCLGKYGYIKCKYNKCKIIYLFSLNDI